MANQKRVSVTIDIVYDDDVPGVPILGASVNLGITAWTCEKLREFVRAVLDGDISGNAGVTQVISRFTEKQVVCFDHTKEDLI